VLVGFMGSGKSTIGRLVGGRLGWPHEDLDERIVRRTGRSIAAIFREDGEERFRALELEEARAVSELKERVVSTGGGAFARAATREALQAGALTVWLRCDLDTLAGRIRHDGSRPLAGNHDIMRALLAEREPFYRMADVAVDASLRPEEVAGRIVELVRGRHREKTTARR
jgi:shikimate kinase